MSRLRPLTRPAARVLMPRLTRPDLWLLAAVAALIGLGVVMVFNVSYFHAEARFGDPLPVLPQAPRRRWRSGW